MDVFEELVRLRKAGRKCALATIVDGQGSIPGYQTARMLVREDGSIEGTIGGGQVEGEVCAAAREVMATEKPKRMSFDLNSDAGYGGGAIKIQGGQLEAAGVVSRDTAAAKVPPTPTPVTRPSSSTPRTTGGSRTPRWQSATCFVMPSWKIRIGRNSKPRSRVPPSGFRLIAGN